VVVVDGTVVEGTVVEVVVVVGSCSVPGPADPVSTDLASVVGLSATLSDDPPQPTITTLARVNPQVATRNRKPRSTAIAPM